MTTKAKLFNNDIRQLVRPGQVRLVNLDLDSPRMKQAMKTLGFEKEDLDTKKRREDFMKDKESHTDQNKKVALSIFKSINTIEPDEIDDAFVNLRFKHY